MLELLRLDELRLEPLLDLPLLGRVPLAPMRVPLLLPDFLVGISINLHQIPASASKTRNNNKLSVFPAQRSGRGLNGPNRGVRSQRKKIESADAPDSRIEALTKVPAVTLGFRINKILATTLGETGGDAVMMSQLGR